jgi:hypothetical protein
MPITLVMQETEIGSKFEASPGKKVSETHSPTNKLSRLAFICGPNYMGSHR